MAKWMAHESTGLAAGGATLVFLCALAVTPSATASNWGSICDNSTDCVSQANNANHAVRYVNLSDSGDISNGIPRDGGCG